MSFEIGSKLLISSDSNGTSCGPFLSSHSSIVPSKQSDEFESRKRLFEIQIWTIDDLALVLDCSVGSIYNKVSKDEIPFHKKGKRGRLYFIPSEILEWIKEGEFR